MAVSFTAYDDVYLTVSDINCTFGFLRIPQQLVTNDNGDLSLEPGQGKTVQCVGSLVIREGDADQLDVGAILTKNSASLEKNKADIEALWTALTVSHA